MKEQWLVDPLLRHIHIYEFARNPVKATRLIDETESFASELLPGLSMQAADVFRR